MSLEYHVGRSIFMSEVSATKKFWNENRRVSCSPSEKVVFDKLLSKYLHNTDAHKVAIEIGCVPGLYLAYACTHFGYFPEGIDFVENSKEITGKTLESFGLSEYKIHSEDFLCWKANRKYDLVLSLGFIEHFADPYEVVKKHIDILEKDGTIVLEVPNFANGQKMLHLLLDRENLSRHNTSVMSINYFKMIAKQFNLKIDYLGYYGGLFQFWMGNEHITKSKKLIYSVLAAVGRITKRISLNNKYFSPYLVMVAEARATR